MKRIIATLSFVTASVILLAGCATASGSSGTQPVNLTKSSVITSLCGSNAASVRDTVASAAAAKPNSGQRHTLVNWGIKNPTNSIQVTSILTTLKQRATVKCDSSSKGPKDAKDAATLSAQLKAQLDASRIQQNFCDTIVKNAGGTVVDGVYTLKIDQLPDSKGNLPIVKADGDPTHLQWSTALALPLQGSTASDKYAHAQLALCIKPVVGVSFAHMMAHKHIAGTSVLAAQSSNWLKFANVDASQINNLVNGYMPLLKVEAGTTPTSAQYTHAATKARDYSAMASKLVYLLSLYQLGPVTPIDSYSSYEAVAPSADGAPEVAIDTALDNKPALVFYYTSKTACAPIDVIGFNTGDTRPEQGTINQDCATPTKTCKELGNCPVVHVPTCEELGNCPVVHVPTCEELGNCGNTKKSHNIKDYVHPDGKATSRVITTPEVTSTQVETTKTGGGGVTDTSTKKSGTETGTTSPGATPVLTAPATSPVDQGGTNGAGDTGGF